MSKLWKLLVLIPLLTAPAFSLAQELVPDKIEILKAEVVSVNEEYEEALPGLDTKATVQEITARILEGERQGEEVTFLNDYAPLEAGDKFYLRHTVLVGENREIYLVEDTYRLPVIYFFVFLFVALVLWIGGIQGIRGLLALTGSLLLIIYVLLPGIMGGYSPVLISVFVSSLIVTIGSYITHGWNKTTSAAVFGMVITVIMTGLMAYFAVTFSKFSGYSSEEAFYLSLNSRGNIDIVGILIGGMMIGLLGVLYDVAIGQAVSVEELHNIAPHIDKKIIYKRAVRIGREHIGALVNTLAIAYVGASLPLFLLFSTPPVDVGLTVNREVFATEIIRTLVGSIGLVLAVPITTFLSVLMLVKTKKPESSSVLVEEREALKEFEYHHHR